MHGQHSAYFCAFADRESLLESFTASVGGNVAEVAGSLTLPVLLIAGEKDEIATLPDQHTLAGPAAGRRPRSHPGRRPPDPLRNPGPAAGFIRTLPEGPLRVKIVIDARFTRTDHHDGISRYGASLIAATAKIADVSMLISDVRAARHAAGGAVHPDQQPAVPHGAVCGRQDQHARCRRRGVSDADDGQLGPEVRPGAHPARPDLLRAPGTPGFLPAPVGCSGGCTTRRSGRSGSC